MRICPALTTLLLVASGSVAVVSAPATAAARPTITLARPAAHAAGDGSRVRFHGRLSHTGTRNNKTVRLQRRTGGSWHTTATLTGQDDGTYAFPGRTYARAGTYTYRTLVRRAGRTLDVSPVRRLLIRRPARDDTAGLQLRASDRVRVTGCKAYNNVAYTVTAAASTRWSLLVTITRPDGSRASSGTVTGTGPASGRYAKALCSADSPIGTYGVRAVLSSSRFATLTETNSFALTAATELLPDLRIKNLTTCSATERQRSVDNGGTDCFSIVTTSAGKKLLKFPAVTGNVGDGPLEVRSTRSDPATGTASWSGPAMQRIYTDTDGDGVADGHEDVPSAATFYWAELSSGTDDHGHTHWHIKDFDDYSIVGQASAVDEKHGFCLQDNTTVAAGAGPIAYPEATSCGFREPNATSIVHGLSAGWGDTYPSSLQDQGIDVSSLGDGTYTVKVTADAKDLVREKDEANNSATASVTIVGTKVTKVVASGGI